MASHQPTPPASDFPRDWKERGLWQQWGPPYHLLADEAAHRGNFDELGGELQAGAEVRIPVHLLLQLRGNTVTVSAYGFSLGRLNDEVSDFVRPLLRQAGVDEVPAPGVLQYAWNPQTEKHEPACHLWPIDPFLQAFPGLSAARLEG